jgi:hypothetical protein
VGNGREQDRWLNTALTQPPASTSADCIDAETLAAFADGALNAQAAAAVELHASSCSRCTAVLAALERSRPAPVTTHVWTPARVMRWLIPLTAAATAVAIWVAVPERPITSVVQDLKTSSEQIPVPEQVAPPVPAPIPSPGSAPVAKPRTQNQNAAPSTQNQEPVPEGGNLAGQGFAPEPLRDAAGAGAAAQEIAPASPPPAAPAPAEAAPVQQLGGVRAERPMASAPSADTLAETVAPTSQRRALAPKVIVTSESSAPNELFRWRVINNTSIERSTDGGKTWTQTIPLPRDSVKGLTIVSIRATSDLHATVRMSNGSEFATANGGRSWVLLQEK